MTFFKTILSVIFLIASSKAMEPATPEVFGLFKGLHAPFQDNKGQPHKYAHFSPLHGVHNQIIKNLRLHGHYEPENKGFPRPNWKGKDPNVFPQDATASLLELLFPSHIGFLVDSCPFSPFHAWLKPKNIALIFNTISTPGFYENSIQGAIKLARALQPDANLNQLDEEERKRLLHMPKGNPKKGILNKEHKGPAQLKHGAYSKLKSLAPAKPPSTEMPFAELLFLAFQETTGECASEKGYPQHVVERILLTYMLEKKKSKEDLKPFYNFLRDDIIDKSAVSLISWSGEESYYSEKDYMIAKEYSMLNDCQINLETSTLLKIGYSYFEDKFPPAISYGVSHVYVNGKWESYSDCGETSLRNFFMMVIYNFATKKFDWTLFEFLKEKGLHIRESLIDYFRTICPSPAYAESQKSRNEWAKILFDLNTGNEVNKIEYLYPTPKTGKYAIAPGLDNMLRVMGKLLGIPGWGEKISYGNSIKYKLNWLCNWFKKSEYLKWDWEVCQKSITDKPNTLYIGDPEHQITNPKDISLLFKLGVNNSIFEWHFEEQHFDFNRIEYSKNTPCKNLHLDRLELPSDLSKHTFPIFFFDANIESITGILTAYHKILWFEKIYNKKTFNSFTTRWIEPTGKYFAQWKDYHTNSSVLDLMLRYKTIDDIFNMKIPELTAHLLWREVDADKPNAVQHLLNKDKELVLSDARLPHNNEYLKMARILTLTLEKASKKHISTLFEADIDQYLADVSGATLLHLAIFAGYGLATDLLDLIGPTNLDQLNIKTEGGCTPLHFAAQCTSRNIHLLRSMVKLPNININSKDNDGNTPLHLAIRSKCIGAFIRVLMEQGADRYSHNNEGKAPLAMLSKDESPSDQDIKILYFNKMY